MSNTIIGSITSKQSLTGEISKAIEYLDPVTQEKTAIPTKEIQVITYDKGYTGLSKVTVDPIPKEYIIPKMQEKSITITENGTQNISADSGYDGLGNVEVNVEVAGSGGGGIDFPIPTMMSDVDTNYVSSLTLVENSLLQAISNENPYTEEAVTLYTPSANHKYYFIRYNGTGYHLIWCASPYLQSQSSSAVKIGELCLPYAFYRNGVYRCSSKITLSMETTQPYKSTNTYSTLEECIASAKDKNTSYTLGSASITWTSHIVSGNSIALCSNMVCFNGNSVIVPNRKISSNETIEVI